MRMFAVLALVALAACGRRMDDAEPPSQRDQPAPDPAPVTAHTTFTGTWTLVALGDSTNTRGAGDRPITMEVVADSARVGGFAGCNRYSGPYTLKGDSITFGALISTKMACPGWPMQLETRFLSALAEATTFAVADSLLTFNTRSGSTVKLRMGSEKREVRSEK